MRIGWVAAAVDCDEIGPHSALLSMARHVLSDDSAVLVSSLRMGQDDVTQLLGAVAHLHVNGVSLDWPAFDRAHGPRRRVVIPTYPFQRERCWVEPARIVRDRRVESAVHPLLGQRAVTVLRRV